MPYRVPSYPTKLSRRITLSGKVTHIRRWLTTRLTGKRWRKCSRCGKDKRIWLLRDQVTYPIDRAPNDPKNYKLMKFEYPTGPNPVCIDYGKCQDVDY